jgi:hypothetical protein
MIHLFQRSLAVLVLIPLLTFPASGASAQDGSMKVCGEKWQAAKAANATNGATWTKFLAECRVSLAANAPTPAAAPAPSPAAKASPVPVKDQKAATAPVFPAAVPAKFADLRPSKGRQKACSEQYQANKATGGNAGLRWLEKGGGYWSLCNKSLKGA